MMGALRYFRTEAERIANSAGIRFDGRDMFVAEVPIDNVQGAMVVVANASAEATSAAALKLSERTDRDARDELYVRLLSIYRTKSVERDVELLGASNHKWRVSVLVQDTEHRWIFEPVTGHYISAVGTAAKFHDFARAANGPKRAAVIRSREDLKDFYGLISGASSRVLTMGDPDAAFESLMAA